MTDKNLFHTLTETLDTLVRSVDEDLPLAEDIHPAIHAVGEYLADELHLPKSLSSLEAKLASAEKSLPAREKDVRRAKHDVTMLETKLKKLRERIDYNRNVLSEEDEKPAAAAPVSLPGLALRSRADIIENLRKEILAAEETLAAAAAKVKKAEANRKGAATRVANLKAEIAKAKKALADHAGRFEETVKILRKTIQHLRNRQAHRDRKREAKASPAATVEETDDEKTEAVSDPYANVRKLAEIHGIAIHGAEDLETARAMFAN